MLCPNQLYVRELERRVEFSHEILAIAPIFCRIILAPPIWKDVALTQPQLSISQFD